MVILGPLIAENQTDSNRIIQKLSLPQIFQNSKNPGETLTLISRPESPFEGEPGQAQEEPLSKL